MGMGVKRARQHDWYDALVDRRLNGRGANESGSHQAVER